MADVKSTIETALSSVEDSVLGFTHDVEIRAHLHAWHPISTVPNNQNLEIETISSDGPFRIPFPCRRLNSGGWINSDLGTRVEVNPVRWRIWSYATPLSDHRAALNLRDHDDLVHTHGPISRRRSDLDQ